MGFLHFPSSSSSVTLHLLFLPHFPLFIHPFTSFSFFFLALISLLVLFDNQVKVILRREVSQPVPVGAERRQGLTTRV
jgi:hypothetical protein